MQSLVGIIRTESELKEAVDADRPARGAGQPGAASQGSLTYNPGWHLALDLQNLLAVSEAIALAALERKESRGGHTRDDYPKPDAHFGKRERRGADAGRAAGRDAGAPAGDAARARELFEEKK